MPLFWKRNALKKTEMFHIQLYGFFFPTFFAILRFYVFSKTTSHSGCLVVLLNELCSKDFSSRMPFPIVRFQPNFWWMHGSRSNILCMMDRSFVARNETEAVFFFLLLFFATSLARFASHFITINRTRVTASCCAIRIRKAKSRLASRARAVSNTWSWTGLHFRLIWLQGLF